MKKSSIAMVTALLVGSATAPAFAADGSITFNGEILDSTCTVTGGAGTDGGVKDLTVTLPTIQKAALAAANQVAGETPFTIVIGGAGQTGCVNGKTAKLWWEQSGSDIDTATGRLKNNGGSATNVQIDVKNSAGASINFATNANPSTAVIAGNTATLNYAAQYYATAAATAGTVTSKVIYSVAYN
ncbi:fimbrial protein [Lysobacter sp. FW306-1B-D06B]|uniref:fimbrial protein n=1 Tax=Lysobacter sp. FW306-1B-D06B TaxID=3140250 RepID=UPI0031401A0B